MNIIELLVKLATSHAALLAEAEETLEACGDCDHSVGICNCKLQRTIENATALQKQLESKLGTLNPASKNGHGHVAKH